MSIQLMMLFIVLTPIIRCSEINKKHQDKNTVPVKQKFINHNIIILKNLSRANVLEQVLRQTKGIVNVTTVSGMMQAPCFCGQGLCSCCSRILFDLWKQKACVNVTYDSDEFAFTTKIIMNDQQLYTKTISGKNPKPFCVPIPRVPVIRACIRFYNIYFQGRNVHACINMECKFQDTTLFKIGMNCLRLGSNGVALVKPEDGGGIGQIDILPENPEDNTELDENDEYYDNNEDDDDFFD